MTLLTVINFKSITKYLAIIMVFAFAKAVTAQTTTEQDVVAIDNKNVQETLAAMDSVKPSTKNRFLIEGVAGVIGDYVILGSDIVSAKAQAKREAGISDISSCELMESLLSEKMYAHHAIQDSITIGDREIEGRTEGQIQYFKNALQTNDDQKIADFYKKDNITQVREALNRVNRDGLLAQRMQERITEQVEITPEEVREFYKSIPVEDLPLFNTEVEMAQIVVIPEPEQEEINLVINKLAGYRADVMDNGADFAAKATLYSDDTGTERQGGVLSLKRNDPFVKEFKDQAFSLQEGEISEPFETMFGWHILYVEKIRGQIRDVRHILLKPYISVAQVEKSKTELNAMRDRIILDEISFGDAAKEISDEEKTAQNGGKIINPNTGTGRIEVTRLESDMASTLQFLEKGDLSGIIEETDPRMGSMSFKVVYIIDKIPDHKADYANDYLKIKDLALKDKQVKAINKWRNEKITDTYIKIGAEYKDCDILNAWN
ncbi:peptidylprolyl isomerase [Nonlabens sp. Ci31]|jgi:peptidyl-prolyl cis-trans isomerase SurA|uniref:peptidylprolyl isomerase n=1 Tax=Nonlabens sp. Ci31 TaxID=2608253 RepID=UPI001464A40A|nr:peptidylprolyl isomerase [Nonlabens sp. Ci31]QJP34599.1 peptidylprolyl isomerase [Nonlabens sp. Ci31]